MRDESLRAGDLVEVKSAAEIAATLDEAGAVDGLPFMPEMLQHVGKRFVVDRRGDKICDTVHSTSSRRLPDTVLLEQLRCDGSAHDGCQAECRLFWKESWLRRVPSAEAPSAPAPEGDAVARADLEPRLRAHTRQDAETGAAGANVSGLAGARPAATYRCQATELYRASQHLRTLDPRPYLREYTSGNVPLGRFLTVMSRAAVKEPLRKLGLLSDLRVYGKRAAPREPPLDLQPGEWAQVKSKAEIVATLSPKGKTRGLRFDVEMLPYCGRTYRVKKRVTRIVDDRNGRMIEIGSDCIILEGVVCSGDHSVGRWFCPREIFPYWRECWLRRAPGPPAGGQAP
jgi:hypothetical protein